jgi:hypothetical protein
MNVPMFLEVVLWQASALFHLSDREHTWRARNECCCAIWGCKHAMPSALL